MSANSKIEWCDHTFNPWWGCTKVSPGCANCYADAFAHRLGKKLWGKGLPRERTSENVWKQPRLWNEKAKKAGTRPRVFCASMADWLDDEVPIEWLADLLQLIHETPNLDWLLLTKRPENWKTRIEAVLKAIESHPFWGDDSKPEWPRHELRDWLADWLVCRKAPLNVQIGTTVEDQPRADQRITALIKIPAKERFLSCEPLLSPVYPMFQIDADGRKTWQHALEPDYGQRWIHWVICGGESGPGAREMKPEWARHLRDQCIATKTPFFFKQWGGVHKAKAGRLLDGVEHNEFPEVVS